MKKANYYTVLNMIILPPKKALKLDEKLERSNSEIRMNLSPKPRRKRKSVDKENETLQNWIKKCKISEFLPPFLPFWK